MGTKSEHFALNMIYGWQKNTLTNQNCNKTPMTLSGEMEISLRSDIKIRQSSLQTDVLPKFGYK